MRDYFIVKFDHILGVKDSIFQILRTSIYSTSATFTTCTQTLETKVFPNFPQKSIKGSVFQKKNHMLLCSEKFKIE